MEKLVLVVFIILLISCDNKNIGKKNSISIEEKESVESNNADNKDSFLNEISLLEKDISVSGIKTQLDGVTTGFLTINKSKIFLDRGKNNFYGFYTLIKGKPNKRVGQLIIYDSINPYIYEKNTDEFVEITLTKKGVSIYSDSLRIGMKEKELINALGTEYNRFNETLIFTSENKKGFFKIKDSLVCKIKIGIYLDSVDVEKLLRESNW